MSKMLLSYFQLLKNLLFQQSCTLTTCLIMYTRLYTYTFSAYLTIYLRSLIYIHVSYHFSKFYFTFKCILTISVQPYSTGSGINHTITRDVGFSLCEAIVAYDEGRVEDCCDILYPLRYHIVQIGGSNAQVCSTWSYLIIEIKVIPCQIHWSTHQSPLQI